MIKVVKLKDLIKYLLKNTIVIVIIINVIKVVFHNNSILKKIVNTETSAKILDENIELVKEKNSDENWKKWILDSEYEIMNLENTNNQEEKQDDEEIEIEENQNTTNNEQIEEIKEIEKAKTDVKTEIIDSGVTPKYNIELEGVKINNSTEYELNEEMISETNINRKKILIYHTHTCESYTPSENYFYEPSGNFRTTDLNYSVARVGDELEKCLQQYDCTVIHDKTIHDYPAYNGSYSRSLNTISEIINESTDIDIAIDIHRDAIADSSYAPKLKIEDEYVSQLMFVVGTDKANPEHKSWNQNLGFAVNTQKKANEFYPGLFKPIILRNSTYNQNVSKACVIIEVGATGNTLEESINSMKYLARVLLD